MATKRKPLTKKVRFDIFKRDCFICQHCGNTHPTVILEIDHITPVSKGGDNSINNLITACFDCNRGKAANGLTVSPDTISVKHKLLKEKEDQIKEYNKLLNIKKLRQNKEIDKIEAVFNLYAPMSFAEHFRVSIRRNFLEKLPIDDLLEYAYIACEKHHYDDTGEIIIRYFCGICWNRIKGTYYE